MQSKHPFVTGVKRRSPYVSRRIFLFLTTLLTMVSISWGAEPYIPQNDDVVLETLPRQLLAGRNELADLRKKLAANPDNIQAATDLANRYVQIGNTDGDPRFYGYARAALRTWWSQPAPPAPILRLRAKLQEKEHRYDAAIADLKMLLLASPKDTQAWIELANIYRVQGNYSEAFAACETLSSFADNVPSVLCRAPLLAMTGRATEAYQLLEACLPDARANWPSTVPWITTIQAQITLSLGQFAQAEQHLQAGLARNPNNKYLVRTYGDFLLDQDRASEAVKLLRDHTQDNGVLLRAAIAASRTGDVDSAKKWHRQLESRFEEIRLRGSQPHGRFEARCELKLNNNSKRALAIALDNWANQKELRDTRNVLEAALAEGDRNAAMPVLSFLGKHKTEDVAIQRLMQELENLNE